MIKLYIYCSAFIIGHLVVGQVVGMKFHQAVMEIVSHDTHNRHKKINMTEKIASQLHEAYNNKGRTAKHLIPQGRIPDLGANNFLPIMQTA